MTQKPLLCVRNVSDDAASAASPLKADHAAACMVMSASIEAEIAQLDPADRPSFMAELGLKEAARDRLGAHLLRRLGADFVPDHGAGRSSCLDDPQGEHGRRSCGEDPHRLGSRVRPRETVAYDDLVAHKDMKGRQGRGQGPQRRQELRRG